MTTEKHLTQKPKDMSGIKSYNLQDVNRQNKDRGPPTDVRCPGGVTTPGKCINASCSMYRPSDMYKPDDKRPKSMRLPARPLCMLETPEYKPPLDDYNELSRFLRLSTVPGYSSSDTTSEYNGNHNLDVWDNPLKDKSQTVYRMRRDWLSNWGEFNVKEQRWRKAWVEKFGASK